MDATCLTFLSAMGTAIAGEAVFIRMLWIALRESEKARVKALEDQLALAKTAKGEIK
jgi:hypothetical protein